MLTYILFALGVCMLLYTYFLYPLVLKFLDFIGLSKWNSPEAPDVRKWPSVTIVISAYNEELVIDKKMRNCLKLDYPQNCLKIIVASDGSDDGTNNIVSSYKDKHDNLQLLELPRGGKCYAINAALKNVESEIIVFSDANTEYQFDAIKKLVVHFGNTDIGCVCGRLILRNPNKVQSGLGEGFYWKYETGIKILESRLGYVAGANGAIYAARRELVDPLPLDTINDDFMISMRIIQNGKKCVYEENAIAYENVAPSTEREFKRHVRDSAGHFIAMIKLWRIANPFLGTPSFIFWSHRLIRWIAPFILIALFLSNIYLLGETFFYILFYLQTAFYAVALLGLAGKFFKLPLIVYIPFYFCNLNLALFLGFFTVILGLQKTHWSSTDRQ